MVAEIKIFRSYFTYDLRPNSHCKTLLVGSDKMIHQNE